ncbi:LAMI_0E07228g1_1 [Lachancea mirantina]|uniref:LAMI_0E07228g1_1 n=1 Tax=Lachancea mirantina TaxID=1230905 RepID=A0A1G4JMB7_9SACH|nr:LAMI_0E07228g1_1 [Lachancea mirantina]
MSRRLGMENRENHWERLLWLKQDYPDNYSDPAFLKELSEFHQQQLLPHSPSSYNSIVRDFLLFYHRVLNASSIYVIFSLIYYYDYNPLQIAIGTSLLGTLGLVTSRYRFVRLKSSLIIVFTLLNLSPLLKSLSRTTSSDSIWTLSCWLTAFYVLSIALETTNIISTNLLVCNAAVLASRLKTTTEVFCFLLICIEINILLPKLERYFFSKELYAYYAVLFLGDHIVLYSFVAMSLGVPYMLSLALFSLVFITVLPRYFMRWQRLYYRGGALLSKWDAKVPIFN